MEEIKGKTENHIKIRIDDEYDKNKDLLFQINYIIEEDFFD